MDERESYKFGKKTKGSQNISDADTDKARAKINDEFKNVCISFMHACEPLIEVLNN